MTGTQKLELTLLERDLEMIVYHLEELHADFVKKDGDDDDSAETEETRNILQRLKTFQMRWLEEVQKLS